MANQWIYIGVAGAIFSAFVAGKTAGPAGPFDGPMKGPLPSPYLGCPSIKFWTTGSACATEALEALTDTSWTSSDGSQVVAYHGGMYNCCTKANYDVATRVCASPETGSAADAATCVYADNYCPTIEIKAQNAAALTAECAGDYKQLSNDMWEQLDAAGVATTRKLTRDEAGTFQCTDAVGTAVKGKVASKYVVCNTNIPPLNYGLNQFEGDDKAGQYIYVVSPGAMHETSDFKAFQMISGVDASDWVKVWILTKKPFGEKPVVIATPTAADNNQIFVALKDIDEASFSIKLAKLAACTTAHGQEFINILLMKEGKFEVGTQKLVVGTIKVGATSSNGYAYPQTPGFTTTPRVLAQMQQWDDSTTQYFTSSRIIATTASTVALRIESSDGSIVGGMVDVGVVAFDSGAEVTGLFGKLYYQVQTGSVTDATTTMTFPATFNSNPIVFAQSTTYNDTGSGIVRMVSSSETTAEFMFSADRCGANADPTHAAESFWSIAFSACIPSMIDLEIVYLQDMSYSFCTDDAEWGACRKDPVKWRAARAQSVKDGIFPVFASLQTDFKSLKMHYAQFADKPAEPFGYTWDYCLKSPLGVGLKESDAAMAELKAYWDKSWKWTPSGRDHRENQLDAMIRGVRDASFTDTDGTLRVALMVTEDRYHIAGDAEKHPDKPGCDTTCLKYSIEARPADAEEQCLKYDYPSVEQLVTVLEEEKAAPLFYVASKLGYYRSKYQRIVSDLTAMPGGIRGKTAFATSNDLDDAGVALDGNLFFGKILEAAVNEVCQNQTA